MSRVLSSVVIKKVRNGEKLNETLNFPGVWILSKSYMVSEDDVTVLVNIMFNSSLLFPHPSCSMFSILIMNN